MPLDYLTFTAPVPVAERLLNGLHSPWISKRSLSAFYEETRRCGGVTVSIPGNPNAAARVEVSGDGCRELEAARGITDCQPFLDGLLREGAKFTRLDYALDDLTGLLCMEQIVACCQEKRVVSRFKEISFHPKVNASTGETTGSGVSFGRRGSRTYLRLYDKSLQMHVSGHWIRVEIETRKERAHSLAKALARDGVNVVPPLLLANLNFKEQGTAKKRHCWKTEAWWTTFLGTTERRRLETAPRNASLEKKHLWLTRCVATSFAQVYDSGLGEKLCEEMLAYGRHKLRHNPAEAIIS